MKPSPALGDLAQHVAAEQNAQLAARAEDASQTERAKQRLRSATSAATRAESRSPVKLAGFIAVAAALLLVVGYALSLRRPPLAFTVNGAEGDTSGWVRVPTDDVAVVHFTDASTITLAASSRARVVDLDANGAKLVLESGVAHVAITHREASKWHVIAGPFDVVVTGTQFDVTWDPTTEQFSVRMTQGTVHVLGTLLGEGHALTTGEQLDVSLHDGLVHQQDARTAGDVHAAADMANGAGVANDDRVDAGNGKVQAAVDDEAPRTIGSEPVRATATVPAWILAARKGDYPAAVTSAETFGFDKACDQAKVADVLALGDAARFTGHLDEAREAYAAIRRRAPDDAAAAESALDLGRIAFDRDHDYVAASKWFDTYGREKPNGPLAREAAGRLIEARQRSGDRIGLEAAAASYLAKYPDGPHADLARSIARP